MKKIIAIILVLLLAACALPETGVRTGSPRPTIYLSGVVKGLDLYVDGLKIGSAEVYDGNPKLLVVEEGAHIVEIRRGSTIVHSEKTFVSNGESRAIVVNIGDK
jgi:hypothetical protein